MLSVACQLSFIFFFFFHDLLYMLLGITSSSTLYILVLLDEADAATRNSFFTQTFGTGTLFSHFLWRCGDYVAQLTLQYTCNCLKGDHLWRVKRICVFEHSVMTNFNCTCPAIQRGQGSGFLSDGSSWLTACMSEQRRFWRDCANAQARLNLHCSHGR